MNPAEFPKVLVLAMGRVNAADANSNGLLLRNLFEEWPRQRTAQIWSSGDNGDPGYFGRTYQLGPTDRHLGRLFYRMKKASLETSGDGGDASGTAQGRQGLMGWAHHNFVASGLYELAFLPKVSRAMAAWVADFDPDVIFAQGYNITFAQLPVLLAERFQKPLVYYPTDDWPSLAYRIFKHRLPLLSRFLDRTVSSAASALATRASVPLAFNPYMGAEYLRRYGKPFHVLMHGDSPARFEAAGIDRRADGDECWIVATGSFNASRIPLLRDLDRACARLARSGIKARATVFPANRLPAEMTREGALAHVGVEPCPSHEGLAAVLRGADILFLPERFDDSSGGIGLSVSSKAHLFMFSGRPTVVYSSPETGLARYAREQGWADLVDRADDAALAEALARLVTDREHRAGLVRRALEVATANHDMGAIRGRFYDLLRAPR